MTWCRLGAAVVLLALAGCSHTKSTDEGKPDKQAHETSTSGANHTIAPAAAASMTFAPRLDAGSRNRNSRPKTPAATNWRPTTVRAATSYIAAAIKRPRIQRS